MAILLFGPLVVGARGLIGGIIFSANKAGPFARSWSRGANPRTEPQSDHRNLLGDIAATWRDLTDAERDDWNAYAEDPAQELTNSLGLDYFISGFNWFVRINLNLEAAGVARRVDAPTLTRPVAPILSSLRLNTTPAPPSSFLQLNVASPNLSFAHIVFGRLSTVGRTVFNSNFRLVRVAVPDGSRIITLQIELEAIFGTIQLQQRLFVQIQSQDGQGQRSPVDTINAVSE